MSDWMNYLMNVAGVIGALFLLWALLPKRKKIKYDITIGDKNLEQKSPDEVKATRVRVKKDEKVLYRSDHRKL